MTIKTHDSWADIDNHFYEKVVALRAKGIRVTIAIGGWNDSLGDKYSKLVRDADNRARFIEDVIEFIEKYNFEGLDLDWVSYTPKNSIRETFNFIFNLHLHFN